MTERDALAFTQEEHRSVWAEIKKLADRTVREDRVLTDEELGRWEALNERRQELEDRLAELRDGKSA